MIKIIKKKTILNEIKNNFLDWKGNFNIKKFYKYYLILLLIFVFGNKIFTSLSFFLSLLKNNILYHYEKIVLFITENLVNTIIIIFYLSLFIFPFIFDIIDYFKKFRLKRKACKINKNCDIKEIEKEKKRRDDLKYFNKGKQKKGLFY